MLQPKLPPQLCLALCLLAASCAASPQGSFHSSGSDIIVLSSRDLSCYSCPEPQSAGAANCTCQANKCAVRALASAPTRVVQRDCLADDWVNELLYDGCLTYKNEYLCICSSSYCNSADLTSIRGNDDCSASPCPTGSICLDTHDGFKCMCPPWQSSCTYRKSASFTFTFTCTCTSPFLPSQLSLVLIPF